MEVLGCTATLLLLPVGDNECTCGCRLACVWYTLCIKLVEQVSRFSCLGVGSPDSEAVTFIIYKIFTFDRINGRNEFYTCF